MQASCADTDLSRTPWLADRHKGLSIAHISSQYAIIFARGGFCARLKALNQPQAAKNPGLRGACKGFSRQARGRLQRKLSSIPQSKVDWLPWLVTLTYPSEYSGKWSHWKRDLGTFRARLMRKIGPCAVCWRLELQARGAPHFHLIMFTPKPIDKRWLSITWYQIVGSGDEKHLRAGTSIERLRTWKGGASYASKYVGKLHTGSDQELGRVWGFWHVRLLDILLHVELIDWRQADRIRRAWRHILRSHCPKRPWPTDARAGLWLYLSEKDAVRSLEL